MCPRLRSSDRRPPPPAVALRAAAERVLDQRQPVVAEVHVVAVDVHRGRSEPAARDQLVDVVAQLLLVLVARDLGRRPRPVEADALDDALQHVVLRDVLQVAPVGLEHGARERGDLAVLLRHERRPHRLDAVDRKDRRRADAQAVEAGPALLVLLDVGGLDRNRVGAALVDALVDRVEDAADQDRLPDELGAAARRDLLDAMEREVGPGARAVVEELESRHRAGSITRAPTPTVRGRAGTSRCRARSRRRRTACSSSPIAPSVNARTGEPEQPPQDEEAVNERRGVIVAVDVEHRRSRSRRGTGRSRPGRCGSRRRESAPATRLGPREAEQIAQRPARRR